MEMPLRAMGLPLSRIWVPGTSMVRKPMSSVRLSEGPEESGYFVELRVTGRPELRFGGRWEMARGRLGVDGGVGLGVEFGDGDVTEVPGGGGFDVDVAFDQSCGRRG
jgi:hypothetical protein